MGALFMYLTWHEIKNKTVDLFSVNGCGCELAVLSVTIFNSSLPDFAWTNLVASGNWASMLLLTQGGLWEDQGCGSGPGGGRVAAEVRCQSEVRGFRALASRLQRAANRAPGQIQDPGDRCHRILHHVPRIWPPRSVLQCGQYHLSLIYIFWPTHSVMFSLQFTQDKQSSTSHPESWLLWL